MTGATGGLATACRPLQGPAQATPGAGSEAPVQLTYLHQWSPTQGHGPATERLVSRFREEFPAIQVEAVYTPQYYEKLVSLIAGGSLPDIATYNMAFLPRLVRLEVTVPLEPLAQGTRRFDKNDMVPAAREMVTFEGKIVAMPYVVNNTGMAYNQTLFRQKGLDPSRPPQTWEELVEFGRRLTGAADGVETWGMLFPRGAADPISPLLSFLWQNGGEVVDMARRVTTWNSPAGIEALQFMVDLVHRYRIAPLQGGNAHLEGRVGMWVIPPGNISALGMSVGQQFAWATAELPRGKQQATSLGGHALVVMKTGRAHEHAWRFVHWFIQPANLAEYNAATTTAPAWRSVEQQPVWQRYLREEPRMQPFVAMLAYGRPTPKLATWQEITDILVEAREAAVRQEKTPKDALDDAARQADPLIKSG
jgi:ABC-type glycerol-3-phosphate transport system substrate-binding protein